MKDMRASYPIPLVLAALCVSAAHGQSSTASSSSELPPGLIRQGNVVMMQPIGESEERVPDTSLEGERKITLVRYLSAADHDIYTRAIDAAAHGDWTDARGLAAQGHDPIATKIIEWRYLLDKNSGASFTEITNFLKDNLDWPSRDGLFARAENTIDPSMDPYTVAAWFRDRKPASGIGKVRLGEALVATGSAEQGKELIREGWIEGTFDPQQEVAIIQRDGALLTPEVDKRRAIHLILHGNLSETRNEISRLSGQDQELAETAIALNSNPVTGEEMLDRLPATSRADPIVLLDETRLLRRQNNIDAILSLLERAPAREMARINPTRWWNELNVDARDALAIGRARDAYAVIADTGLDSATAEYAEAQFLAGWIALRQLKEPAAALTHFRNLAEAVSRPISKARAHFWEGRAYETQGNLVEAWRQYRLAADYPDTFYGQVALARLEPAPRLRLVESDLDADGLRSTYDHEELTRALHVAGDLGIENLLRAFALRDVEVYPDARHVKLLAEDLTAMGFREVALRVAKQAEYNGVHLPTYSHPVISVPPTVGAGPEPALVLGIIRQETEFDPDAVSSAGARGIMQVMPSSAAHDAQLAGVDYRPQSLTDDTYYNMQLGMAELSSYLSNWGGSYVLAAAAYNAGAGNARKWIATYGDPRNASVDPIDWIEEIPFAETRNYVQRVIENTEVYRNRLSGRDEPLQILADIYRPNAVQIAPLPYSPAAARTPTPLPRPATSAAANEAAPESGAQVNAERTN